MYFVSVTYQIMQMQLLHGNSRAKVDPMHGIKTTKREKLIGVCSSQTEPKINTLKLIKTPANTNLGCPLVP